MRTCLLSPPAEADHAADLLSVAAEAILDGRMGDAAGVLREADIRTLHAYAAYVMREPPELLGFRKRNRPAGETALVQPLRPRMPSGLDAEAIFKRDGFRCRYCGCRVVKIGVRSLMTAHFPDVVRWPCGKGGDQAKHAAFFALNGVLDHVVPYARGGSSSVENIVTACWPCNGGKAGHTLEELCLSDPRDRAPVVDGWDGLSRLAHNRRKPAGAKVMLQPSPLESPPSHLDEWMAVLGSITSQGVIEALRDLLVSLEKTPTVRLAVRQNLSLNVAFRGKSLSILSISFGGDVDVPWHLGGEKDWFRPFAESLTAAIPDAILYETPKMWRVDGCGTARGQITVDELVGASAVVLAGVEQLAHKEPNPLS